MITIVNETSNYFVHHSISTIFCKDTVPFWSYHSALVSHQIYFPAIVSLIGKRTRIPYSKVLQPTKLWPFLWNAYTWKDFRPAWRIEFKNPLRRTSEHNHKYNFLNFSFFFFRKKLFCFLFFPSFFSKKLVVVW